MIYVTFEGKEFLDKLLNDLLYLKIILDIRSNTVPLVSLYTINVTTNKEFTKVVLTIENSEGNLSLFESHNGIFYITNTGTITLGTNTLRTVIYNGNDVVETQEEKFECKYILSLLLWIAFVKEEVYKDLLPEIDKATLQTIPLDFVEEKFRNVYFFPFYLESEKVQKIVLGLFERIVYGSTYKGIFSFLNKIKEAFSCNYRFYDLRECSFWRLPKKYNNEYLKKFTDVQIDLSYEMRSSFPLVYEDTNQSRTHYFIGKKKRLNLRPNNVEWAMILSVFSKLVGYIIKWYDLKQYVSFDFTVPKESDLFIFDTNLPCIVKNLPIGAIPSPILYYEGTIINNWTIEKNKLKIFNAQPGSYLFKCYTIPKDVLAEGILLIKSLLCNIRNIYYDKEGIPLEVY